MLSVGSRSVFALVVGGETLDEVLPGRGNESARSLTAELVDPGAVADDGFTDRDADCLVVDSGAPGVDSTTAVKRWVTERPHTPVVLLVEG